MVPMSLLYQDSFRCLCLSGCLDVKRPVEGSAIAVMSPEDFKPALGNEAQLQSAYLHKSGADMCHSE